VVSDNAICKMYVSYTAGNTKPNTKVGVVGELQGVREVMYCLH
jgi:hypothetical protein